jgi:DeoR/GlpR family transcriptional regulator of sugar metabolism
VVRKIIGSLEDGSGRSGSGKVDRRRGLIVEHLLEHGSVAIKDLAELQDVSLITIHRDLDELERQGMIRKLRGYVTAQPSSLFESTVSYRLRAAKKEKEALSRFALTQIEPGQSIMMDDSTTTLPLARLLYQKAPLKIITNFRMTLNELSETRSVNLISLGGEYSANSDAYFGIVCEQAVASLSADVFLTSAPAVSEDSVFHPFQDTVRVKRAMMDASARRIALFDHTKFGKKALNRLGSLQDFDLVVVDSGIDQTHLDELRECSVPLEIISL